MIAIGRILHSRSRDGHISQGGQGFRVKSLGTLFMGSSPFLMSGECRMWDGEFFANLPGAVACFRQAGFPCDGEARSNSWHCGSKCCRPYR